MKETLIVLCLLFLAGQVVAVYRSLTDWLRRNKGLREKILREQLDRE